MKGNLNILKSKFVRNFIGVVLAVIVALTIMVNLDPGGKEYTAEEMAALTGDNFQTVFPIGKYDEIYAADSEAGIFLVRETDGHLLVNADGEVLAQLPGGKVDEEAGGNFVIKDSGNWYFINSAKIAETGRAPETSYEYAEIDAYGKYVLVKENDTYRVLDAEENEVYVPQYQETEPGRPYLTGPEGYIVEDGPGDHFVIVNFIAGETEYQVPEGIRVSGYRAGHWFMDCAGEHDGLNFSYYYMLDRDYNLAADGAIFTAMDMSNSKSARYVDVQQELKVSYETRDILAKRALFDVGKSLDVVYNADGEAVYGALGELDLAQEHGNFIRYIKGDFMAASTYNETVIDYINLSTQEVLFEDSEIFCLMDWEDGAAAAAVNANKKLDRDDRSGRMVGHLKEMKSYKWGLVDENLQPLTEFVFDGVYPGDEGYAVVLKEGRKGLIRLKEVN